MLQHLEVVDGMEGGEEREGERRREDRGGKGGEREMKEEERKERREEREETNLLELTLTDTITIEDDPVRLKSSALVELDQHFPHHGG